MDAHGMVFATASRAVAEAQFAQTMLIQNNQPQWEIAEFVPESWRKQVEQWVAQNKCPECGAGPMPITGFDDVLGGCAIANCPISPETGRLATRVMCGPCPSKDHCTMQMWCELTGHPVDQVSTDPTKT